MADGASVSLQATVLPDEIAKTFSATLNLDPEDGNDKWYYKLTSVPNTSQNLITGSYTDYTAVDSATAPLTIDTAADLVKFLFVKNTDATESVYITLDGTAASSSATAGLTLGPDQGVALRLPNGVVDNVKAISSAGTVECIVCALLDDVA